MSVSIFRHYFIEASKSAGAVQDSDANASTTQSSTSTSSNTITRQHSPSPTFKSQEATVSFRHHYLPTSSNHTNVTNNPAQSLPVHTNTTKQQSLAVHTWLEDQEWFHEQAYYDQAVEMSCRQGALAAARRLNSQLRARKTHSPSPAEPSSPVESAGTEAERMFNGEREKPKQVAVLRFVKIPSRNSV
ncbi:hypothetical protein CLAFUR0_01745 [Fulvia fulva]|nr:hypothetical protein CLAFUR0_01745 [Fulvia fulva]